MNKYVNILFLFTSENFWLNITGCLPPPPLADADNENHDADKHADEGDKEAVLAEVVEQVLVAHLLVFVVTDCRWCRWRLPRPSVRMSNRIFRLRLRSWVSPLFCFSPNIVMLAGMVDELSPKSIFRACKWNALQTRNKENMDRSLGKQTGEVDGNSLSDIIDADAIGAPIKSDDTSATVWVRAESLLDFLADIGPRWKW